jgi:hypothetical protein
MRGTLRMGALGLFAALAALVGCAEDKYNLNPKFREEAILPPDEKRYNEPDTATYRKPPPPKDEKALIGRNGGGAMPGPGGGF